MTRPMPGDDRHVECCQAGDYRDAASTWEAANVTVKTSGFLRLWLPWRPTLRELRAVAESMSGL